MSGLEVEVLNECLPVSPCTDSLPPLDFKGSLLFLTVPSRGRLPPERSTILPTSATVGLSVSFMMFGSALRLSFFLNLLPAPFFPR